MAVELDRVAQSALDAFLGGDAEHPSENGHPRPVSGGAVAAGVALGVVARFAYSRMRRLDLEAIALAAERHLKDDKDDKQDD